MTTIVLPTDGRVGLAEKLVASTFVFALSRGNPAWDGQWSSDNPPTAGLNVKNVLDPFGYVRPTIKGYLAPDDAGQIYGDDGGRYSVSTEPTRYMRAVLSIPVGEFAGQTLREIGLFMDPTIKAGVPNGQQLLAASDIVALGRLQEIVWSPPFPLEAGTHYQRNCVVRL